MKAVVNNNSGLLIKFPKEGFGILFFMEWIAQFNSGKIQKVILNEDGFYKIRFNGLLQDYIDCRDYINANI